MGATSARFCGTTKEKRSRSSPVRVSPGHEGGLWAADPGRLQDTSINSLLPPLKQGPTISSLLAAVRGCHTID
jgi:hypothetical protein